MRAWLGLSAACLVFIQASPASAHWVGASLGMSFADLRAAYPEAKELKGHAAGSHALELSSLTYSGVRWRRATLVFNAADRLDHVTFEARDLDYDFVKTRVDALFHASAPMTGAIRSRLDSSDPLQMRICQVGDRIDVTFEAVQFDS